MIKRCLSVLLILTLLLSLFAGLELSVEAASYLYNTGKRGQVCTELSSYAKAYYTGNYTYAKLSALSKSSLRTTLNTLVNNKKEFVYADLREYLAYTDADYSNKSNLILFYCSYSAPSAWDGGSTWNREHVWPQSMGGNAVEGDLHSMRPTDPTLNSTRNNNLYGESHTGKSAYATATNGNALGGYYGGGDYFEPLDNVKGDCARIILYDYVAQTAEDPISEVFESVDILLKWCALDPVDEFEMSRNDVAQSIQNNRNPFVDYPELAWVILGKSIPTDLVSPSGSSASNYTITATSSNTSYGTVSLSGNTITATPKTGYYVSGYTIVSGSATVTQNGNVFTVVPTSNCQIRINFAKKTTVTVSFNDGTSSVSGYAGETVTLPAGKEIDGYHFVGWTEKNLSATTQMPTYYAAGQAYTTSSSVTLYALYSYTKDGTGSGWSLVTGDSQLYSGAQLVLASNAKGKIAGALSSNYLSSLDQSFSTDLSTISALTSGALVLTLGGKSGAWTLSNQDGQLLGATEVKKLAWDNGATTWTISVSEGTATVSSTDSTLGRFLYNVNSPRFTTYASNTTTSMLLPQLYMQAGGTVYYTTEVSVCTHSSLSYTAAKAATCTNSGNVAYYTCKSCGAYFSDSQGKTSLTASQILVSASGHSAGSYSSDSSYHWQVCTRCGVQCTDSQSHSWDQGTQTQAPTESTTGVMTYTCTVCKATYTETIPALGKKYTLSFSVPSGVDSVADMYAYAGGTVTLPSAGTLEGFTFVGWVRQNYSATTMLPTCYYAGQNCTLNGDVTLYALYSYSETGSGTGWTLVTEESRLYSGARLVMTLNTAGKVAGAISGTYMTAVDQSFSSDLSTVSSFSSEALVLTLGGKSGAWTLSNASGELLGCTTLKTLAWGSGTTAWSISVADGSATIAPNGDGLGRILYNSSYPRFTTYTSNVGTYMFLPQLYMQGGTELYYTTQPDICTHATLSYTAELAATCTEDGNISYYTCKNCGKYFADAKAQTALTEAQIVISALGHNAGNYDSNSNSHWQVCTRCGVQCTDSLSHSWDQGTQTQAPTEELEGVMTYTCTICKATYTESIPALGPKLTLSFSVPQGVAPVASLSAYKGERVTLPGISGTPGEEYTFVGWTTQTVDHSTASGTVYQAGATVTLNSSVTLKALFSYSVSGGSESWDLAESTDSLRVGSQVVLGYYSYGIVAGALSNQVLSTASASFGSGGKTVTTLPSGALILTLGGKSGAWTLANDKGQLLGATAQKKLAWNSGTTTWAISISSGEATITSGTSSYGSLLYSLLYSQFTTYTSTFLAGKPQLYVRTEASTTYYTTEFAVIEEEPTVDSTITINHTLNLASDISVIYAVHNSFLSS
ncbi:MAG: endonuclease, partial [Oscillospiraceae bacterium]|nr:endonuclease [Oscillospiraceae bacterium]